MAIIKCPECGKEISDKATSCPSCGFPLIKGQPEKEKVKEYTVEINDSMYIQATSEKIKVFYNHNQIMESPVDDFVLNYSKEEPDDFGRSQLKIAFSIPSYKDSFKICVNANSEKYESTKDFLINIADKYFKKDFVSNWYLANEYAKNHADKFKSGETNVNIQKVQNNVSNQSNSFSYQQFQEEKKKNSVFASAGFTIFMILIFWPVGIFAMWRHEHFKKSTRIILTVLCVGLSIFVYNEYYSKQAKINRQKEAIQEALNEVNDTYTSDTGTFSQEVGETESSDVATTNSSDYAMVGDTVNVNNIEIAINDADLDFQDYDNEYGYNSPQDGMKYVKASFTYTNIGNSDNYASIYDFKCYADNQTCEQAYGLDDSGFMNTNLSPGRSVSFSTYYQVPINSQSIELEYSSLWSTDNTIIKLQ